MNTSPVSRSSSARSGFVCHWVRRQHARRVDDATASLAPWASRHAAKCPACREYFAAVTALETRLGGEAKTLREDAAEAPMPAGLEDRIWAAVAADRAAPRRAVTASATPSLGRRLALGGLAALVLGFTAWVALQPRGSTVTEAEINHADLQALAATIEDVSVRLLADRDAVRPTPPGTLEAELSALNRDAGSALRFLRDNFVPTERREKPSGSAASS